jgi:hypothetical protein
MPFYLLLLGIFLNSNKAHYNLHTLSILFRISFGHSYMHWSDPFFLIHLKCTQKQKQNIKMINFEPEISKRFFFKASGNHQS